MNRLILVFVMISIMLTGCSISDIDPTSKYDGGELKIGIIGSTPEVRENQIKFEELDFDSLREVNFNSQYDAIFITQNNLLEASKDEYVLIYKKSKIPFYFIESKKSHVPFTEKGLLYEDVPDIDKNSYIIGLLYTEDKFWGYGLYNSTRNETNIKGVYSRVFNDISKIKDDILP